MDARYLFLFISLIAICPMPVSADSDGEVGINVSSLERLEIVRMVYTSTVTQWDSMSIKASIINTGSASVISKLQTSILDSDEVVTDVYNDGYATMVPGEERTFEVTYTAMNRGWNWIRWNTSYGTNKEVVAWGSFYVFPYSPPPGGEEIPTDDEIGGGETGAPSPEVGLAILDIEYDRNATLAKGQNYLFYVEVKNIGTGNKSLEDIVLTGQSFGIPFDVTPKLVSKLSPGNSVLFIVSLSVPRNIEPGDYDFIFNVKSRDQQKGGKLDIRVVGLGTEEELQRTIENYRFVIERLRRSASYLEEQGANVTAIKGYLNDAWAEVDSAEDYMDLGDLQETGMRLELARALIEKAAYELAMLTVPLRPFQLPAFFNLVVIIVLILLAILLANYLLLKRARERKEEKETEGLE